ncbi:H/ACA ribonucleoprotein complex non-core subunit NAF1-like, partial [Stegodyphus dumicola]|uniref:H/ACA ribonucleoprotein complex non-core subunit NAF1-like n=1 Tax=Stegodyphus dumicola TaxID=202533 RepID=UPI0015AFADCF
MGEQFHKNSAGVRNMSLKMNTNFNRGRSSNFAQFQTEGKNSHFKQRESHLQPEGKNYAISHVDSSFKESGLGLNKIHQKQLHQENVKTKGKLQVKDMPPIENLDISKIEKGMKKIGIVHAVVDKLVIVKALEDTQQLELDSVLFLSSGNPLGQVFEKFGKHEPFYCIRFKNSEHIKSKGIAVDDEVFFAPDKMAATPQAVEETTK